MIPWPPPPPAFDPDPMAPPPPPPLTLLKMAYDWAYQTLPVEVWDLPLRQQSDEVLKAVCAVCRCLQLGCRGLTHSGYMGRYAGQYLGEYYTLVALGSVDVDDLLRDIHADVSLDPFPAAAYDPLNRKGRTRGRA